MNRDVLPSTVQGTASSKLRGAYASNAKRRKAIVTYGRKSRPLSTTGKQFLLPSVFDLPPDDSGDDRDVSNEIGPSYQTPRRRDSGSDSSLLSGAEDLADASDDGKRKASTAHGCHQQGKLKSVSTTRTKPTICKPIVETSKRRKPSTFKVNKRREQKLKTKTRRLPVDELHFATGPSNNDSLSDAESESSLIGHEAQDPIRGTSSPGHDVGNSTSDPEHDSHSIRKPLVSLHAFRKRFRKSITTQKDFKQLPRKQLPGATTPSSSRSVGDGFEGSESIVRRKRKRRGGHVEPVTYALAALELGTGPLPAVEFTDAVQANDDHPLEAGGHDGIGSAVGDAESEVASGLNCHKLVYVLDHERQATSQAKLKQDLIAAQLSSISAPGRPAYDADSEEEDLDIEDEEDESINGGDLYSDRLLATEEDDLIDTGGSPSPSAQSMTLEDDPRSIAPTSAQRTSSDLPSTVPESVGVHYDFRKRNVSGHPLRRNINVHGVIEADGPSEDFADFDDIEDHHETPRRHPSSHTTISGDEMLDDDPEASPAPVASSLRLRSILKSSTGGVPHGTTRPEHTAYNTRRNSAVQQASSRYFAEAQEDLAELAGRSRPITKVRRRSSYLEYQCELEPGEGNNAADEASPEAPDYTGADQLSFLRRAEDAVYTSSRHVAEPKDLRSLTRQVSAEYGTLSQSVRRRPSLGFRSPTKVL